MHYIGHGIANEVFENLPLASAESFSPLRADRLDGNRTPFVFLCACVAGRVRSGTGGYQIGLASKLVERGAPAALAFGMPVTEARAYTLAGKLYRSMARLPFGAAVSAALNDVGTSLPAYASLSLTAYGDPSFVLPSMTAAGERASTIALETTTWASKLRNHCVLRTITTAAEVRASLDDAPRGVAGILTTWLDMALKSPIMSRTELLDSLETAAGEAEGCTDAERLSIRAAVCAERLHASGLETLPIEIATDPESIRSMLADARFLAVVGGALFDMRLNGLGNSLMGRVITADQNDAEPAALYLRQGREKLLECEDESDFVRSLRADDERVLEHFGLSL